MKAVGQARLYRSSSAPWKPPGRARTSLSCLDTPRSFNQDYDPAQKKTRPSLIRSLQRAGANTPVSDVHYDWSPKESACPGNTSVDETAADRSSTPVANNDLSSSSSKCMAPSLYDEVLADLRGPPPTHVSINLLESGHSAHSSTSVDATYNGGGDMPLWYSQREEPIPVTRHDTIVKSTDQGFNQPPAELVKSMMSRFEGPCAPQELSNMASLIQKLLDNTATPVEPAEPPTSPRCASASQTSPALSALPAAIPPRPTTSRGVPEIQGLASLRLPVLFPQGAGDKPTIVNPGIHPFRHVRECSSGSLRNPKATRDGISFQRSVSQGSIRSARQPYQALSSTPEDLAYGSPVTFFLESRPEQFFGRLRRVTTGAHIVELHPSGGRMVVESVTPCDEVDMPPRRPPMRFTPRSLSPADRDEETVPGRSKSLPTARRERFCCARSVQSSAPTAEEEVTAGSKQHSDHDISVGYPVTFRVEDVIGEHFGRVRAIAPNGTYIIDTVGGGRKVGIREVARCEESVVAAKELAAVAADKARRPSKSASVGLKRNRVSRSASPTGAGAFNESPRGAASSNPTPRCASRFATRGGRSRMVGCGPREQRRPIVKMTPVTVCRGVVVTRCSVRAC